MVNSLVDLGLSLFNSSQDRKARDRNNELQLQLARENMAMQREFAQQGVRWRVEDAKAAGVHPLFALGAQVTSASPVSAFTEANPYTLPQSLSDVGQDIGRAVHATRTGRERMAAWEEAISRERGLLENDLLRAQIAKTRAQIGPPLPGPITKAEVPPEVQGRVDVQTARPTATDPGNAAKEAWQVADYGFARTAGGGLAIVPSQDVKDRIEDQIIPELSWALRNTLIPNVDPGSHRPDPRVFDPGPGKEWVWVPQLQEYRAQPLKDWEWLRERGRRRDRVLGRR